MVGLVGGGVGWLYWRSRGQRKLYNQILAKIEKDRKRIEDHIGEFKPPKFLSAMWWDDEEVSGRFRRRSVKTMFKIEGSSTPHGDYTSS